MIIRGWSKAPWVPYSAELVADLFDKDVDWVRSVFGETVLVRQTFSGVEFKPGPPTEAEIRARVSSIIAEAVRDVHLHSHTRRH